MALQLSYTTKARCALSRLQRSNQKKHRKVEQTLARLCTDPRYPSLQTHKFASKTAPGGKPMFEAYVDTCSKTSAALRIFWYYSHVGGIVIDDITNHP